MDGSYAFQAIYGVQERDPTAHIDLFQVSMEAPDSLFRYERAKQRAY